jgi:hypothetical protein
MVSQNRHFELIYNVFDGLKVNKNSAEKAFFLPFFAKKS